MSTNADNKWSRRQIAETAEALMAGHISFIEGGRKISQLSWAADLRDDPDVVPFIAIDSETDTLPVDENVRRLWAASALEKLQPEIEKAEAWARTIGLRHCQNLIDRFKRA
jgi:hypothetical protein